MSGDENWVAALQGYIRDHALDASADFDAEHDVERRFRQIMESRRQRELESDATLREIPRFFFKKPAPSHPLHAKLRKCAQRRFVLRKHQTILDADDRLRLSDLLSVAQSDPSDNSSRINYDDFMSIGRELAPKGEDLFCAATFLMFRRDRFGRVSCNDLLEHITYASDAAEHGCRLSFYDSEGKGYLREPDLENYIFDLIPHFAGLQSMQENFHFFYVCTAVRRFFFFLDPKRTGKVSVQEVAHSRIHQELQQLDQWDDDAGNGAPGWNGNDGMAVAGSLEGGEGDGRQTGPQFDNWFSCQSALRVYSQYLELDTDQNGMLTKDELLRFSGAASYPMRLTDVFVSRVFQEYHTYAGEMDYRTFLDFTLAIENKRTPQSLQYFWRILDIDKKGYLDSFTINYFFREIVHALWEAGHDPVMTEDVRDEIFDMVKPKDPLRITLDDLLACKVGHIIVSILIDVNGFWLYDNRESIGQQADEDEDEDRDGLDNEEDDASVASLASDGSW